MKLTEQDVKDLETAKDTLDIILKRAKFYENEKLAEISTDDSGYSHELWQLYHGIYEAKKDIEFIFHWYGPKGSKK